MPLAIIDRLLKSVALAQWVLTNLSYEISPSLDKNFSWCLRQWGQLYRSVWATIRQSTKCDFFKNMFSTFFLVLIYIKNIKPWCLEDFKLVLKINTCKCLLWIRNSTMLENKHIFSTHRYGLLLICRSNKNGKECI
jgi:hypothetical protein